MLVSLFALFCVVIPNNKHRYNQFSDLSDPIGHIKDFLPHPDHSNARLINQQFNRHYHASHSQIIDVIGNLTQYIKHIVIEGNVCNETLDQIQTISNAYKFNKFYLKHWPKIIQKYLNQSTWSKLPWNLVSFRNFRRLRNSLNLKFPNTISVDRIVHLLILASQKIFGFHCFDSIEYLAFHKFIYEKTWKYILYQNASFTLPSFQCIYYLHLNAELYEKQIAYLTQLSEENGLIIWDPEFVETNWTSSSFYQYMDQFMVLSNWMNECREMDEFSWYLQIKFVFKFLEIRQYDNFYDADMDNGLFGTFGSMIIHSIEYLHDNQIWYFLDELLFLLHQNNALLLLKAFGTDTFMGILYQIYVNHPIEYGACDIVAKSLYYWFVSGDENRSIAVIVKLADDRWFEQNLLSAFIEIVFDHYDEFDFSFSYVCAYLTQAVDKLIGIRQDWNRTISANVLNLTESSNKCH